MDWNNIISDPIYQPQLSELAESFSWPRPDPNEITPDSIVPWQKNKRPKKKDER